MILTFTLVTVFILLGVNVIRKGEIKISSKRRLVGNKAKGLGLLFLAAGTLHLIGSFPGLGILVSLAYLGYLLSTVIAVFMILTAKPEEGTNYNITKVEAEEKGIGLLKSSIIIVLFIIGLGALSVLYVAYL